MPSPDVAGYLGLELLETDEQQLITTALANVSATFPDWTPREGNTEVVLLEALAAEAAETVYALNRIPDGLTEVLLRLFGVQRDQGAPPSADVRFTVADTLGHTIPAGVTVRLDLGEGIDPVDLITAAELVIPAGELTGVVTANGIGPSIEANGQPAGKVLELLDSIASVDRVELATAANGGRIAEDGAAFIARAIPRLARLTTTLVRPVDVEAYVAENAAVSRVKVLDLFNPADPASTPGTTPGYVAVAVAGPDASPVPTATKDTLAAELRSRMHAGLTVNVIDADVTAVDVTVRVLRYAAADPATVEAAVVEALTGYLDPDAWGWGGTVRVNELIAVADRAAGVDTVLEVTTPAADLDLAGYAPLVTPGVLTVVVEAP